MAGHWVCRWLQRILFYEKLKDVEYLFWHDSKSTFSAAFAVLYSRVIFSNDSTSSSLQRKGFAAFLLVFLEFSFYFDIFTAFARFTTAFARCTVHAQYTFVCRGALGTRVNPNTIGCVWTRRTFWIRKEKVADSNGYVFVWTGPKKTFMINYKIRGTYTFR